MLVILAMLNNVPEDYSVSYLWHVMVLHVCRNPAEYDVSLKNYLYKLYNLDSYIYNNKNLNWKSYFSVSIAEEVWEWAGSWKEIFEAVVYWHAAW